MVSTGLVDANDGDSSLRSPLMSVGDGRAKEHLIQVFLLIEKTSLISLTSEERRARPDMARA